MEIRFLQDTDDRMAISKIYEKSWRYAYKGIIPQSYLDSIEEGRWADHLENDGKKTLVMIENDTFIGTTTISRSRYDWCADYGEIIAIYFLPEYIGKGYGKDLLDRAMLELRKMGCEKFFLWVLEENMSARRFYEKCGFTKSEHFMDGSIGGKTIREIQYVKVNENNNFHYY